MGFILIACATLGLLCVGANLLEVTGKIVVASLENVVRPVLIFMLVLFAIYCINR